MSSGSKPVPTAMPLSEPFWEAAAERRLALQWCTSCEIPIFFPREACPKCLGTSLMWRDATGRGVVYAFTVVHNAAATAVVGSAPFIAGLVDLDEGVRLPTNLVGFDGAAPAIGQAVKVTWRDSEGCTYPIFEPA